MQQSCKNSENWKRMAKNTKLDPPIQPHNRNRVVHVQLRAEFSLKASSSTILDLQGFCFLFFSLLLYRQLLKPGPYTFITQRPWKAFSEVETRRDDTQNNSFPTQTPRQASLFHRAEADKYRSIQASLLAAFSL